MMRSFLGLVVFMGISAMGLGCGDEDDPEQGTQVTCPTPAPTFAEVTAFSVCVNCHSSTKMGAERNGATIDVNFDAYASAKTNASLAAHEVEEGHMPPPMSGFTLTAEQKQTLLEWAACGAPQ